MTEPIGLTEDDLLQVTALLRNHSEVDEAILFGSRAKGTHTAGSDVDIALEGDSVNFQTVLRVSQQLNEESLMPYRFDILDLKTVTSPELVDHIKRVGMTIYSKSK